MVVGNLPFKKATDDDPYYRKFQQCEESFAKSDLESRMGRSSYYEEFFKITKAENTSSDFKSLIIKMLSCNSNERPSIIEILNSSWMKLDTMKISVPVTVINQNRTKNPSG